MICMGERTGVYRIYWGNGRDRSHLEDKGTHGRIILSGICRKWDGEWCGLIWFRIGTGSGLS